MNVTTPLLPTSTELSLHWVGIFLSSTLSPADLIERFTMPHWVGIFLSSTLSPADLIERFTMPTQLPVLSHEGFPYSSICMMKGSSHGLASSSSSSFLTTRYLLPCRVSSSASETGKSITQA